MAERNWTWTGTRAGDSERRCSVAIRDDGLHWGTEAKGEEEELGVHQLREEFRDFGPPESREYLAVPGNILDEVCALLELKDPGWRKPLAEPLASWFAAAEKGDRARLEDLLTNGVPVNALDHNRRSALWRLTNGKGNIALAAWLLDLGANVNLRDRYGRTLLMMAAVLRDGERVELYLKHGADKTIGDSDGETAYITAIESRAYCLICHSLNSRNDAEWPQAIHAGASASNVSWLRWQTQLGSKNKPEVNVRYGPRGRTPLQACFRGYQTHPEAVRWLVENGADLTVVDPDDRTTILHHAVRHNLPWLVAPCVKAGVAMDAQDGAGQTALSLALDGNEHPALMRALVAAGAEAKTPVPGREPEETAEQKAKRMNLVWSAFLLRGGTWSGLCCHAEAQPESGEAFWLEFPAEWCGEGHEPLSASLKIAARTICGGPATVRVLGRSEAERQPWGRPGKKLWAVLPDGTSAPIERFRDARPVAMWSFPEAWAENTREQMEREWKWPAPPWTPHYQPYTLRLRRGELTWKGYNLELKRSLAQFRVEGPPTPVSDSMPREATDELCALLAETAREWEAVASDEVRRRKVEEWTAAQPQPVAPEDAPPPPPHQSGKYCYAKLEIEDRFNTPTGTGSDSEWTCWAEFPAEWAYEHRRFLRPWLKAAMGRVYDAMNRRIAEDPEGGSYVLRDCHATVLSLAEAKEQPWGMRGKVLYLIPDNDAAPTSLQSTAPARPVEAMADPGNPPAPAGKGN